MSSLMVPLRSPLSPLDEQRAVNRIVIRIAMVRHTFDTQYSREWLESRLRDGLREGRLTLAIKAGEAADRGDEIADRALRVVGAELQMALTQGRALEPGHLQVLAYLQRALQRPPAKRGRGGSWHDHWVRNIGICIIIERSAAEFRIPITRNRDSRRGDRRASIISLVTKALARNRIHLDESTIQKHLWFGLPGELVRECVSQRMGEFVGA